MKKIIIPLLIIMLSFTALAATQKTTVVTGNLNIEVINNTLYVSYQDNQVLFSNNNFTYTLSVLNNSANLAKQTPVLTVSYLPEAMPWVDYNCSQNLITCMEERAKFDATLSQYIPIVNTAKNTTDLLNLCKADVQTQSALVSQKASEVDNLKDWQSSNKNQHWIWLIVGLLAGVLGTLWKDGKLFGGAKDMQAEQFNPSLAS